MRRFQALVTLLLAALVAGLLGPTGPAFAAAPNTDTVATDPDRAAVQGEAPVEADVQPLSADAAAAAAVAGTRATFVGHGQGHLRGMSQWGSYGYAVPDHGWAYTRILDHYYGGTTMGVVANSTMTIRLRAQTGRDLIVSGSSLRINGVSTSRTALRVVRTGSNKFRVDGASACGGPWTIGAPRTGPVTISRPGWDTTRSATLMGICSGNEVRRYGGTLKVLDNAGLIETVNAIPLETYLRGVVPRESPAYWGSGGGGKGINALRSQAVAARSYALASTNSSFAKTCDTTECQVYGGMFVKVGSDPVQALHSANSDRAIADTRGKVRVYRTTGAVARTEFGASSGGWTAGETFPAVQDLGDDTTDSSGLHNPYHDWSFTFSMAQVQSALGISGITDVRVTATAGVIPGGGKATRITVYATGGRQFTFDGDTIRRAFGLHSNWFRISTDTSARRSATAIVQALYVDLLGRRADASGLRIRVDQLVRGTSIRSVANALTATGEYRRALARKLYRSALGTEPSVASKAYWANRLQSVPYWKAAGSMYASDAVYRKAGSSTDRWVDLVFRSALGASASAASKAYWKRAVATYGRVGAAERMLQSDAAGRWSLRTLYRTMLAQNPSSAAYRAYSDEMTERGWFSRPGLVAQSSAYRARAQTRFWRPAGYARVSAAQTSRA